VRIRVKICGCTGVDDVAVALDAGADAVGVILAPRSPRAVGIDRLQEIAAYVPALVSLVAVFTDPSSSMVDEALKVGAIPQFHGAEPASVCEAFAAGPYLKAYHVGSGDVTRDEFDAFARPYEHATWLFDTAGADGSSGGTGEPFAWEIVRRLAGERHVVVAGGLNAENVGACVRTVRPFAVDVRSGVETDGKKDARKVRAFVEAVRTAEQTLTV
jgi:phosphoribosylanthranilate isomerase